MMENLRHQSDSKVLLQIQFYSFGGCEYGIYKGNWMQCQISEITCDKSGVSWGLEVLKTAHKILDLNSINCQSFSFLNI